MSDSSPTERPPEPAVPRPTHLPPPTEAAPHAEEATQSAAAAAVPAVSAAESELWDLIGRVERLALTLPGDALSAAASRLQALAGASGSQEESWLAPRALTFAGGICQRCQSVTTEQDGHGAAERAANTRPGGSTDAGERSEGEVGGHEWQGPFFDDHFDGLWAYRGGALAGFGDAPPTYTSRPRDLLGLRKAPRCLTCDYHDRRCGGPNACMAEQVLQQRMVAKLVETLQRQRSLKPQQYGDGGSARFRCYRAIIADRIADPLGPGNRVRLPECVMTAVRRLVCNVACGCDFGAFCMRQGHYTGFRTVEESRGTHEAE
uniref:Uncharacterized protein n=1 Tax=Haptolina brevifila TaxID=156173 RepID=A0A7S2HXR9_9EUKA